MALEALRVTAWWAPWTEDAPDLVDPQTIAVLVVTPLGEVTVAQAVAALRQSKQAADTPVFAVLPDGAGDREARRIYRAGATAVLDWPWERRILPRLLAELLAVDLVRGSQRGPDGALARTLRAHLRLARGFGRLPRVQVRDGVAVLAGWVRHLWQRQKLEEIVARVPGVRSVITRDVHVEPDHRSDAAIKRSVRHILRDATDIEDSTLAIRVDQGFVTLAGSVSDRRELNRVTQLVTHVRGVRGIDRLAVVSDTQKTRDQRVATRLRNAVSQLHLDRPVTVSFFGGVAVLTGRVDRLSTRREITAVVNDDDAVHRIVNKLDIETN